MNEYYDFVCLKNIAAAYCTMQRTYSFSWWRRKSQRSKEPRHTYIIEKYFSIIIASIIKNISHSDPGAGCIKGLTTF
jgi:hypothetical protein